MPFGGPHRSSRQGAHWRPRCTRAGSPDRTGDLRPRIAPWRSSQHLRRLHPPVLVTGRDRLKRRRDPDMWPAVRIARAPAGEFGDLVAKPRRVAAELGWRHPYLDHHGSPPGNGRTLCAGSAGTGIAAGWRTLRCDLLAASMRIASTLVSLERSVRADGPRPKTKPERGRGRSVSATRPANTSMPSAMADLISGPASGLNHSPRPRYLPNASWISRSWTPHPGATAMISRLTDGGTAVSRDPRRKGGSPERPIWNQPHELSMMYRSSERLTLALLRSRIFLTCSSVSR